MTFKNGDQARLTGEITDTTGRGLPVGTVVRVIDSNPGTPRTFFVSCDAFADSYQWVPETSLEAAPA